MTSTNQPPRTSGSIEHYDAVVIGAGVNGTCALHHLRQIEGKVVEAAGIGPTPVGCFFGV